MGAGYAWCELCKPRQRFPVEEIMEHLRDEHDFTEPLETWPDGDVVIVDNTLEPADFE